MRLPIYDNSVVTHQKSPFMIHQSLGEHTGYGALTPRSAKQFLSKLSDLPDQTGIIRDWRPVEDPAFIGDPSSRRRSGTGMTGTRWLLFVIPAPHPVRDKLQPESRDLAFLDHQNRSTWVLYTLSSRFRQSINTTPLQ
jgi:hypothetical protein